MRIKEKNLNKISKWEAEITKKYTRNFTQIITKQEKNITIWAKVERTDKKTFQSDSPLIIKNKKK